MNLIFDVSLDSLLDYVASLVIYNSDGDNSKEIEKYSKNLNHDDIGLVIVDVANILANAKNKGMMEAKLIKRGINNSLPILLDDKTRSNPQAAFRQFLKVLDYEDKLGHSTVSPEEVYKAIELIALT